MPQMSPMFWLVLMFSFTLFYLLLLILTFFKFIPTSLGVKKLGGTLKLYFFTGLF